MGDARAEIAAGPEAGLAVPEGRPERVHSTLVSSTDATVWRVAH